LLLSNFRRLIRRIIRVALTHDRSENRMTLMTLLLAQWPTAMAIIA